MYNTHTIKDYEGQTCGDADWYCWRTHKKGYAHQIKLREFRVKCMGDKNLLDEMLENAEKLIRKKQDGEPEPEEARFKKKRLLEVTESNMRLKKPEIPCMLCKQYTSTYGNPASKEIIKRGHKTGYCAGVNIVLLHDLVEKNKHLVAAGELVSSFRKEDGH